ncbi:hypothetical protein CGK42_24340, partial [Vibrio parahaemolyticus]|uniref:hypothetical protein n=1 Tax=Vibrio parahaemolyticus TaxID=670 RepID=UPI0011673E83
RSKSALTIAQHNLYEDLRKDFEKSRDILNGAWKNALKRLALSDDDVTREWSKVTRKIDSHFIFESKVR